VYLIIASILAGNKEQEQKNGAEKSNGTVKK
jgi:hypothetical protein